MGKAREEDSLLVCGVSSQPGALLLGWSFVVMGQRVK